MESKRTLIHEDRSMLSTIVADLKIFIPAMSELKKAYEKLEVGKFTSDVYKQLVSDSAIIDKTREYFFKELDHTLKNAGLLKEGLRKVHIDQANLEFANFKNALTKLKSVNPDPHSFRTRGTLSIQDTSFIDDRFQVSAMDQESIMDKHCRIYLENEHEVTIHSLLKNIRDSINEFNGFLDDLAKGHELNGLDDFNYQGRMTDLITLQQFLIDDAVKEINPRSIRWVSEMIAQAKSKKSQSVNN
jgi:hypothetical protein